jgi:RHS repeat-associated protein
LYPATPDVLSVKFTGKERDAESGLDYFGARYTSSAQGRFTSPDPLMATPIRLIDPQEWNMYAYVRNNPLSLTDVTGLDLWLQGCGNTNTATCQNNYVGTTDQNGNFTRTHIAGDQTASATIGENGISVNVTNPNGTVSAYQGVWDQNPNEQGAVLVAGTGDLASFNANVTGSCNTTCVANGQLLNKDGSPATAGDVRTALQGKSDWFANNADFFHQHDGTNDTSYNANPPGAAGQRSTDVTVPQNPSRDVLFHVNSGYPFQDVYQMTQHVISIMHTFTNAVGITHPTSQ